MGNGPDTGTQAVRIGLVLHATPGLTVEEIHAGLRARHYVATPQDVIDALAGQRHQFRSEQHDGATRWYAMRPHSAPDMPRFRSHPEPVGWAEPPSELPWEWPPEPPQERPSPETVIAMINEARSRRGDAVLDSREAAQVAANLERRAADPSHYRNVCWNCTAVVDEGTNEHCSECRWLVCWCGACRKRTYVDRQGVSGACRREVWTLHDHDLPDVDFRGRRIVTATHPASDADSVRRLSRSARITALFHWSPVRAIPSIVQWGLLARPELKDRGIPFVTHGYGSPEKERELSAYVATSLRPKLGMMGAWSDSPVIWELDPEILVGDGVLFVAGNSASAAWTADQALESKGVAALERSLAALDLGGQPEILVPSRIPRVAITRAHVADETAAVAVRRMMEESGGISGWDVCWAADCPAGAHRLPERAGDTP